MVYEMPISVQCRYTSYAQSNHFEFVRGPSLDPQHPRDSDVVHLQAYPQRWAVQNLLMIMHI